MSEKIPHSRFDTHGMTPKETLTAWYESIDVMFDARVNDVSGEAFQASIDAYMLGDLMLASAHVGAQSYERSNLRIGRDGVDHYLLQFYLTGGVARRDNKGEINSTQPGDLWITDLAQPLSSLAARSDAINLIIPRRLLSPSLEAPDIHSMRILSGQKPLVALLRSHLQALMEQAASMTIEDARAVISPTLGLAAAALNGCTDREETILGVENALLNTICRHVKGALPNADITAEQVAGQFGISLRKLSYLFESFGGFASWLRRQRLALVREALTDPVQRHRTIEEIAEAHCFSHKANLGRAFRALYGMTPGQVRALARERLAEAGIRDVDVRAGSEWRHWIAKM
ncbi:MULTISPECIES: helix-turn-helix domain-containing protein [unclassified Microbulbifer]|uniref:helix-turn-helix domain-containing protein n=1 Tax=unclassified Microbulbifer TaxID=2619833 RepID=UPI0027E490D3|nr:MULTISPECIES: helix-turn-helix domain-containing protein [unclassified Microbulbifer]